MLPTVEQLRRLLGFQIDNRARQGHDVTGLAEKLEALPASYDALVPLARELDARPLRTDWPHVEPVSLEEILEECAPDRPTAPLAEPDLADAAARAETGFLASACGCMLGKPLEINPTLEQLRFLLERTGDWPLRDYVSEAVREHLPAMRETFHVDTPPDLHVSWPACVRERIRHVAPDDDLNYSILGMLALETYGLTFTLPQLMDLWLKQLPVLATFGCERLLLIRGAQASFFGQAGPDSGCLPTAFNPGEERCGAVIRADAYGFACQGHPALAAELAWRDASMTHRRTGVYGTMFIAAWIACAGLVDDPLEAVRIALQCVPQRSRFHKITADCLRMVQHAPDWLTAYERIHARYGKYGHCQVYQEMGLLINTLRFATDIGDGICKQVMQGCDTDSFGCTAGSLLGVRFGPGRLDERWLRPFNDRLHTSLAQYWEPSLSATARRMGLLPARVRREQREGSTNDGRIADEVGGAAAGI